jgi:hypothetical protein
MPELSHIDPGRPELSYIDPGRPELSYIDPGSAALLVMIIRSMPLPGS